MVKSIFFRPWDLLCTLWFVSHFFTSLLVDGQIVFPSEYFPKELLDLTQWHIHNSGDHLVRDRPVWFKSLVYCEMYVQMPFFLLATYAYLAGKNWIRVPAIMYGVHAATTTIPMLADFWLGAGADNPQKMQLVLIYGTYFAFPALIALSMACTRIPFPSDKKRKTA